MLADKFNYRQMSGAYVHHPRKKLILFDKLTRELFSKINRHLNVLPLGKIVLLS